MAVKLLFGFDTERPFGKLAEGEEGKKEREGNLELVSRLQDVFEEHGTSRTFFILGEFIKLCDENLGANHLRQVFQPDNPLVEIAQHTYSHTTIAPIETRPDKIPITPGKLRLDLKMADGVLKGVFALDRIWGLRTPLGYARGLSDYPNILNILGVAGFEYVSSSLRDSNWGINPKLKEYGNLRQPFLYGNGLVEVPAHGWQDSAFTGTSKTIGVDDYPTSTEDIFAHYRDLIKEAERLSGEAERTMYIGFTMHPWAIRRYDPKLDVLRRLLDFSRDNKCWVIRHRDAAREVREQVK